MMKTPTILDEFDNFLQDEFFIDNLDMMILDDDMPDAFDNYISNVTSEDIYAKATKFYTNHQPLLMKMMGDSFYGFFFDPAEHLTNDYCELNGIPR